MEILRTLDQEARRNKKQFIVIGGHAINAHGISRTTGDLDLMVQALDRDFWRSLLLGLKYTIRQETDAFILANPPVIEAWPVDLVLVNEDTFSKALTESMLFNHGGTTAPTASVQHLVAMKLHALRSGQPQRDAKDFGDLVNLIRIGQFDLKSEEFRQLCLKYGNLGIYERLIKTGIA